MELPKNYDPKEAEPRILKFWKENRIYKFDSKTTKPIFKIDTPPPTLSGRMHIGHAFSYSQQDFIARYKRMRGFELFYPFGTDDNGLATEKLVQKEKKVDLRKTDRKEAIRIVLDYLENARAEFIEDWKNIGVSCDFDLYYSTISEYAQKISQKSFLDLYKKGLIERREGPVMWDRVFQTAIAQAELEDAKRRAFLNYVKAKIEGSNDTYIIYATTRPELCFAAVGVSVENEGDYVKLKVGNEFWICSAKTYKEKLKDFDYEIAGELKGQDLIGKKVTIPVSDRIVEISHDIAVDDEFGTGIAYFCTYGGLEDIEWAARHNAEPVQLLDKSGRLNEKGGKYSGMLAEEARKQIIADMESSKFIIKKEEKEQIVNIGERSGVEVEYIVSNQWYVKYLDKKELFLEQTQKFNWYPEHMKSRLENWIKGLNWDWGFSRQRHFGIPIPVWYDKKGNAYLPDEDQLPVDPTTDGPKSAPKDIELIPETDVFDTWFTSASSPFLAINLMEGEEVYKKLFPLDLRPQAHDIINFWLFYTMAKTNLLRGENPFRDVMVSGWALDPKGEKMSKSKGNVIAPEDILKKHSRDALRYWASAAGLGDDIRYSEQELTRGTKLATKIWNAGKLVMMNLEGYEKTEKPRLTELDKWLLSKLSEAISNATQSYDEYQYSKARSSVEQFFWLTFCDYYLEMIKDRFYNRDRYSNEEIESAQYTLYHAFLSSIKMLAPVMPFITEEMYQIFFKELDGAESIHKSEWPKVKDFWINPTETGDMTTSIIGKIREHKSKNKMSMAAELERVIIFCKDKEAISKLTNFENVIRTSMKIKNLDIVTDKGNGGMEISENVSISIE